MTVQITRLEHDADALRHRTRRAFPLRLLHGDFWH
jgi:hypothetical protein